MLEVYTFEVSFTSSSLKNSGSEVLARGYMSLVDPVLMAHVGCGSPLESVHYCYVTLGTGQEGFTLWACTGKEKIFQQWCLSLYKILIVNRGVVISC